MNELIKKFLETNSTIANLILAVTTITGAFAAVIKIKKDDPFLFWTAVCICLTGAIYIIFRKKYLKGKRNKILTVSSDKNPSFIRGLLPFEKGQVLLGRAMEVKQMRAILQSSMFKFGYISGEAGSGKTSFVRASVITDLDSNDKFLAIYLKSPQPIIDGQLIKTILQELGVIDTNGRDELVVLRETVRDKKKQVLLAIDQFEEYFIMYHPREQRKRLAVELKALLEIQTFQILICLRKEFVEDLKDLAPEIPNPLNMTYSVAIRNWDTDTAKDVFFDCVKQDNIPFSEELQSAIIYDLAQKGVVRPIELQMVAKTLYDQRKFELSEYNTLKRAQGIIGNYIRSITDSTTYEKPALEILVTKYLLKSLCNDGFDAKRTDGGLTKQELFDIVRNSIRTSHERSLFSGDIEYCTVFDIALKKCFDNVLIINSAEDKYNLVHDYIARPIKDVTADIQTTEETANNLLKTFIERRALKPVMPIPTYLFIKRHAKPANLLEYDAAKILKRSKRRYFIVGSSVLLAILAFVTYLGLNLHTYNVRLHEKFTVNGKGPIQPAFVNIGYLSKITDTANYLIHCRNPLKLITIPEGDYILEIDTSKFIATTFNIDESNIKWYDISKDSFLLLNSQVLWDEEPDRVCINKAEDKFGKNSIFIFSSNDQVIFFRNEFSKTKNKYNPVVLKLDSNSQGISKRIRLEVGRVSDAKIEFPSLPFLFGYISKGKYALLSIGRDRFGDPVWSKYQLGESILIDFRDQKVEILNDSANRELIQISDNRINGTDLLYKIVGDSLFAYDDISPLIKKMPHSRSQFRIANPAFSDSGLILQSIEYHKEMKTYQCLFDNSYKQMTTRSRHCSLLIDENGKTLYSLEDKGKLVFVQKDKGIFYYSVNDTLIKISIIKDAIEKTILRRLKEDRMISLSPTGKYLLYTDSIGVINVLDVINNTIINNNVIKLQDIDFDTYWSSDETEYIIEYSGDNTTLYHASIYGKAIEIFNKPSTMYFMGSSPDGESLHLTVENDEEEGSDKYIYSITKGSTLWSFNIKRSKWPKFKAGHSLY